jgi:hypothetical protein
VKATAPQRLPVRVGDSSSPVGFVDIGTLGPDGFTERRRAADDVKARGGKTVHALQSRAYIEIKVDFTGCDATLFRAICGDPLAYLAWQFRALNPPLVPRPEQHR